MKNANSVVMKMALNMSRLPAPQPDTNTMIGAECVAPAEKPKQ